MTQSVICILLRAALATLLLCHALAAQAENAIVPADAKLELLHQRSSKIQGGLTEGPAAAPDGSIYFTDIPEGADRGQILRYDPKTGRTTTFTVDSGKANGLAFDAAGRLIACEGVDGGGRRISRWDVKTGKSETIVDRIGGKRFNAPNDLCIDKAGRIYFTDPKYVGTEARELEHRAVYRIDIDGGVSELTHDVEKPNGVAVSPDQKTLYVADTNNGADGPLAPGAAPPLKGAMKVYAFPLSAAGEIAGPRRTVIDFGADDGCDGMTVDSAGNLYLAARNARRPGVLVLDPNGKELAYIATGKPQPREKKAVGLPSNCEFGVGDDRHSLYITVDTSLYRIRLKTGR
ncbi:MAG TPA: SMP-30/gluconolactonase/LRE family protein [Pirellulales bacterium]|jgi:gluconolactonase